MTVPVHDVPVLLQTGLADGVPVPVPEVVLTLTVHELALSGRKLNDESGTLVPPPILVTLAVSGNAGP